MAVKFLHSETSVEDCKLELQSLAQVHHPNCLRIFGFEILDEKPALILEFVEGLTLFEAIRFGAPNEDQLLGIFAQVYSGLKHLEGQGLSHGDLSPSNIMIDCRGVVRLLDFGLANCQQRVRCTPEFAAPELLVNERSSQISTDLFSLGRIVNWAMGFQLQCEELKDLAAALCAENPQDRAWSGRSPQLTSQLGALVQTGMAKKRAGLTLTEVPRKLTRPILQVKFAQRAALVFLQAMFLITGAAQPLAPSPEATLEVRTNRWVRVSVDGRDIGYAPIQNRLPSNKSVRLTWLSSNGPGERTLTLRPAEHILLDDSWFQNP